MRSLLILLLARAVTVQAGSAATDTGLFSQPLDCYMCFTRYWNVQYDAPNIPNGAAWKEYAVEHKTSINDCSYKCLANKNCSGATWLADEENKVVSETGDCNLFPDQKNHRVLLKPVETQGKRHSALMTKRPECKSIATEQNPNDENLLDKEIINCCNQYGTQPGAEKCNRVTVLNKNRDKVKIITSSLSSDDN